MQCSFALSACLLCPLCTRAFTPPVRIQGLLTNASFVDRPRGSGRRRGGQRPARFEFETPENDDDNADDADAVAIPWSRCLRRNAKPCVLSGVRSRPWTRTFPLNPSMEEGRIQTVSMSRLFISPVVFPCLDTKCFGVTCYCMLIRWPCLCEALCDVANQSTYTNIHCRATCTHTWRTKTKALVFSSLFDV